MSKQAYIKKSDVPTDWSFEAADFINKLLIRKPPCRLGYRGANEVKAHDWFSDISWDNLLNKKVVSPFIPKNGDNFDKKYCESIEKVGVETKARYDSFYKKENFSYIFNNFTFINNEEFVNDKYANPQTSQRKLSKGKNEEKGRKFEETGNSKYLNYLKIMDKQTELKQVKKDYKDVKDYKESKEVRETKDYKEYSSMVKPKADNLSYTPPLNIKFNNSLMAQKGW